jgi:hypothetical protein
MFRVWYTASILEIGDKCKVLVEKLNECWRLKCLGIHGRIMLQWEPSTLLITYKISNSQHDNFSPEDGDSTFLRNVGMYLSLYTASKPRTTALPSSSPEELRSHVSRHTTATPITTINTRAYASNVILPPVKNFTGNFYTEH